MTTRPRHAGPALIGLMLAAVLVTACQLFVHSDPMIDGWPIGREVPCSEEARCVVLVAAARAGLDRRDPGHPAVVTSTLHTEGATSDADGNRAIYARSGALYVVVQFELADGSVKAIGVGAAGPDPTIRAFDYGP
jgi:hypothetical protein